MLFKHIGIIGLGTLGGNLSKYYKDKDFVVKEYDPPKGLSDKAVLSKCDIIFICVPTPFSGGFDSTYLHSAFHTIKDLEKIVVIRSTIPPGTTDKLQEQHKQHKILFVPEFLSEVTAEYDIENPTRNIIGTTSASHNKARSVLALLPKAEYNTIVPAIDAEMIKYVSNSFYAMKVSFANQIYDLCQKTGINYDNVKAAAMADPMIGKNHLEIFHKGYRGYGGKCLPKDTKSIIEYADKNEIDLSILKAMDQYNEKLKG